MIDRLVELDGFEKVSKEIHTHYQRELGVVSGSENKKEILGVCYNRVEHSNG